MSITVRGCSADNLRIFALSTTMRAVVAVLVFASIAAVALGCEGSFCTRPDFGSCGNACCKMSFAIGKSASYLEKAITKVLVNQTGGPDGRYTPQMTAEGTLLFADLRPFKIPGGVDFLGQVHHRTLTHHYNDTINILIASTDDTSSKLTMFSTSQIAGAYGDASQNYANIMKVVANLSLPYSATTELGCPPPSTPSTVVSSPESLHAQCHANYTFTQSCSDVSSALKTAGDNMSGFANCGSSEKCGYTIQQATATVVQGTHETPVHHYKDSFSFGLEAMAAGGCLAVGQSSSGPWYAVLDDGTNLCNLRNLVAATGLKYSEAIDTSRCTQYKTANCDKY